MTDVVERLEREAAHERRIADYDGDALVTTAHVPCQGQAFSDGDTGTGVSAIHDVVLALLAPREAADAAELAKRTEAIEATGE